LKVWLLLLIKSFKVIFPKLAKASSSLFCSGALIRSR
jgi:hypothetical protein